MTDPRAHWTKEDHAEEQHFMATATELNVPRGTQIKVYRMNDTDWVAAANLDDAKACLAQMMGEDLTPQFVEEFVDDPRELTEAEMRSHTHRGEDGDEYDEPITFREELDRQIAAGVEFPIFFATTEI